MVIVAALLHDDVDDATQRAAVLGFNARALDLDFLNEVKGTLVCQYPPIRLAVS